eukprot:14758626-Alexandrium_andersonii.AAC.1
MSHCRPSSPARQLAVGPFARHDAMLIEASFAVSALAMTPCLSSRPHLPDDKHGSEGAGKRGKDLTTVG